uniref:Uncharacterized protein n=1 Tax=Onchocerca volvulus TaxID=6282 RepID=A0A2K6W8X2_ONCVO
MPTFGQSIRKVLMVILHLHKESIPEDEKERGCRAMIAKHQSYIDKAIKKAYITYAVNCSYRKWNMTSGLLQVQNLS